MKELLVSIIIPCKDKDASISGLEKDISIQEIGFSAEIIRIDGVKPSGKARNSGAKRAKGEILVFMDCDIRLGNEFVLRNLLRPLLEDENIGVACSSVRVPPNASSFQIRYAKEIPHCETLVVDSTIDVSVATTQCLAVSKEIFHKSGRFNEEIIRGVDPEFSLRLREAGWRVVLSSNTVCYHPQPDNIIQLIGIRFRDGLAVSFADTFYSDLNIDVHPESIIYFSEGKNIFGRMGRFFSTGLDAILEGKTLLLLSKIFYALGYLHGVLRYRISRCTD